MQIPKYKQAKAVAGAGVLPSQAVSASNTAVPGKTEAETLPKATAGAESVAGATDNIHEPYLDLRVAPEQQQDLDLSGAENLKSTLSKGSSKEATGNEIPEIPTNSSAAVTPIPLSKSNKQVVLHAKADCWIEVRDGAGAIVVARLLRVGENYLVPIGENLTLLAGNAGGLQIELDGEMLPGLGSEGTVIRNLNLDPEALLEMSRSSQ